MSFVETLKSVELLTTEAFNSYVNTLLWSSIDDDGDAYDSYCDISDINEDDLEIQWNECHQFIKSNSEAINQLIESGHELEKIMHDFCLTRNRHGAGFWDGDYPDALGQQLTDASHQFNEVNLCTGDDGEVYIFVG